MVCKIFEQLYITTFVFQCFKKNKHRFKMLKTFEYNLARHFNIGLMPIYILFNE
ncbi:hypothetical protein [uncultured Gammaproteobacteria bacterium]|jgi:hypothetical protein|nr:hypothetical protein [uncultured Gammaproteobacteria bacterium]